MNKEMKHTPMPWIIGKFGDCIFTENNSEIIAANLSKANAAFIVRAVNSHEELLEAAKAWMKYSKTNYSGDGMTALSLTEKAITKAEGKS